MPKLLPYLFQYRLHEKYITIFNSILTGCKFAKNVAQEVIAKFDKVFLRL